MMWIVAAVWLGFIIYWSSAAAPAARSSSSSTKPPWIQIRLRAPQKPQGAANSGARTESRQSRGVHERLLLTAILLALLPWFWPLDERWISAALASRVAGLGVLLLGAAIYVWAKLHLGRFWSGRIQTLEQHVIIDHGPYRWVRHPMYTGLLIMFIGTALVSGELHALLGLLLGVATYVRKIRLEERHLLATLGDPYRVYRAGTWALLPGLY